MMSKRILNDEILRALQQTLVEAWKDDPDEQPSVSESAIFLKGEAEGNPYHGRYLVILEHRESDEDVAVGDDPEVYDHQVQFAESVWGVDMISDEYEWDMSGETQEIVFIFDLDTGKRMRIERDVRLVEHGATT